MSKMEGYENDYENFKHKFWKATIPNNYDYLNRIQTNYKINCLKWQPNSCSVNYVNNIWVFSRILFSKSYFNNQNQIYKHQLGLYELKIPHEQTKIKNYNEIFYNCFLENNDNNDTFEIIENKFNYDINDICLNIKFINKENFIAKCKDNNLYLYNENDKNDKLVYTGHDNIGWALDLNESQLISGSYDNKIILYNLTDGKIIQEYNDENNSINDIKIYDENEFWSLSDEGFLRLYDNRTKIIEKEIKLDNCINCFNIDFCANVKDLFMVTKNNLIEFYDFRNFKKIFEIEDVGTVF